LERLARTAIEASKQSGRAWSLRIAPELTLDQAITADGKSRIVLADGSGETYTRSGADSVRLLVGPEGGWTNEEIEAARRAGCTIARFGRHVMRIETACVAACACVMQVESKS
jgi:16S rRNA (uracil1498-N3)-methyltransferase